MVYRNIKSLLTLALALVILASCSPTRYKAPKKPHNSFRPGKKNKWMEEKRRNLQQF